jgi:membrane complex biogenesis BtpA family protein
MKWIEELFHESKPVIGMCHLEALPGDPGYASDKGLDWVVEQARRDLLSLQRGGVDGVIFSNEKSLPYLTKVEPITLACMAAVITELRPIIDIPFGVNVLWDPKASIDVALATKGLFVREIFTGVYASDFGLWNTNCGEIVRHQYAVNARHIRLFFNILPEASRYLGDREISDIAKSTVFNAKPDALCVSGLIAGSETCTQTLSTVKSAVPDTPVFANTGVRLSNAIQQLSVGDGAIIGTYFKRDGYIWNEVDESRVKALMAEVKAFRK